MSKFSQGTMVTFDGETFVVVGTDPAPGGLVFIARFTDGWRGPPVATRGIRPSELVAAFPAQQEQGRLAPYPFGPVIFYALCALAIGFSFGAYIAKG